ncbi:amidophosphoribosyltransferase [bacterium DOLZORAL124_64_63]|nr:MAG: amidophosphoribosyltransferase [bacterium DOLZORAL124_64_63]
MTPVKKMAARFLDFIYPAACHLCHRPLKYGRHLCTACSESLHYIEPPFCSRCGEAFDGAIGGEFVCPNCHELKLHFDFARAALHSDDNGRKMVHDLKYGRQIHLADSLASLAATALDDPRFSTYLETGMLVPVPLHWMRQRKRRFNQSEEIARCLAKLTRLPAVNALRRDRNTETQTRFSRKKRLKNLTNAFSAKPRHHPQINGSHIILVDDVFTTGSTANECAKTLKSAGAKAVSVLTVLRG